jgi:hypothetical protein
MAVKPLPLDDMPCTVEIVDVVHRAGADAKGP